MNGGGHNVTWASAQARSAEVNGYPKSSNGFGFLRKHMRSLSASLPVFSHGGENDRFAEKEKLGRGRWQGQGSAGFGSILNRSGRMIWRFRLRVTLLLVCLITFLAFFSNRKYMLCELSQATSNHSTAVRSWYRRTSWLGGGSKFVVILAANQGGGVMEWKGAREWAIERDSVKNKKKYVANWGYELEIVDMSTKKRYAHEWRESWEKVDTIRNAMRKYPKAEW